MIAHVRNMRAFRGPRKTHKRTFFKSQEHSYDYIHEKLNPFDKTCVLIYYITLHYITLLFNSLRLHQVLRSCYLLSLNYLSLQQLRYYVPNCVYPITHPVNYPCGGQPEHPEKTHDFRQSVD
jgi:hypothetical protein